MYIYVHVHVTLCIASLQLLQCLKVQIAQWYIRAFNYIVSERPWFKSLLTCVRFRFFHNKLYELIHQSLISIDFHLHKPKSSSVTVSESNCPRKNCRCIGGVIWEELASTSRGRYPSSICWGERWNCVTKRTQKNTNKILLPGTESIQTKRWHNFELML